MEIDLNKTYSADGEEFVEIGRSTREVQGIRLDAWKYVGKHEGGKCLVFEVDGLLKPFHLALSVIKNWEEIEREGKGFPIVKLSLLDDFLAKAKKAE